MLFPRDALTSGPQACFFAEKKGKKVKGARWNAELTAGAGKGYDGSVFGETAERR